MGGVENEKLKKGELVMIQDGLSSDACHSLLNHTHYGQFRCGESFHLCAH